ncbi:MAG TPA: YbhB/YbcL family Raf kinase inhibitor-like protein [Candidatus Acidoferrum sp.]|nr:YbhB/YbcL family Raf kinase inhibitor-like protein [Candidatus Acidoferrum sp.]
MAFHVFSNAFTEGGTIPRLHSCEGADVSPSLEWRDPPSGTLSFALVMDDPDAPSGLWTHWMLWDIPARVRTLAQGAKRVGVAGVNDFGKPGYGGPCPPAGQTHRYIFRLYAIGAAALSLSAGAKRRAFDAAIAGKVVGEAVFMGRFHR